jgi:type IV pilus assembly protein PilY1
MPHAPPSRHPSAARPGLRRALAALAAAALVLPGAARAATKTFSANSLIIPVQIEYQSDEGIVGAYGLVYSILRRNPQRIADGQRPVTFHWAIAPNKLSQYRCNTNTVDVPTYGSFNDNDGCDFTVQLSTGSPVALLTPTNGELSPFDVFQSSYTVTGGPARGDSTPVNASRPTMKYLGGAWIVDATDRQAFIEMLGQYPELAQYRTAANDKYVRIHSAKTSFTAPIVRILNQKPPRIAVVDTNGASFLVDVLAASGLDAITNWDADLPNGVVIEKVSAATLLDSDAANGFPHGRLNEIEGTGASARNRYGLIWIPDGGVTMTADRAANLKWFLDSGFGAYVEANSIDSVENDAASRLHTVAGIQDATSDVAYY